MFQGAVVDRWLVSDPVPTEAASAEAALEEEHLTAGPLSPLFPDRDVEVAGTYWHLLRRDGAAELDLEQLFPERPVRAVIYAHAYVRAREDRTVRLSWHGPECGRARARLNGQLLRPGGASAPVPAGSMGVRLAAGWNTLLLEMAGGECPYRFGAQLEAHPDSAPLPARDGKKRTGERGTLRVQASRPPGVRRTYPAPWVSVEEVGPEPRLHWPSGGEDLRATIPLELTAWGTVERLRGGGEREVVSAGGRGDRPQARRPGGGRPAPSGAAAGAARDRQERLRERLIPPAPPPEPAPVSAAIQARAGGGKSELTEKLEPPGRPLELQLPFSFAELRKATLSGNGLEVVLRWRTEEGERKRELLRPVAAAALLRSLHAPIPLSGWTNASSGEAATSAQAVPAPTPTRRGAWTVPPVLAGFTLELSTRAAPGAYRLNGTPVSSEGESFRLCSPCRTGSRIELEVEPHGEWSGPTAVRIVEAGFPQARRGAPPAGEWLRALGGEGNRAYLELAARFSGP
ncbi:MAG: hypothetical protein ACE5HP_11845 [Gemmatimonadota bacterium]